ncbi:MAG: biotin/lipoyl-binding protein [Actinomycetota bacterium]|nr:biotin/lipoyl-binding protein [Actinomycetota bacterium]
MAKKIIKVVDLSFRDGFQSVFGARVLRKDYLPAIEAAKEAGITSFEAGGGAMFQSLFFYCNENAFETMEAFRKAAGPDASLQTLARGVNVVGLDSQPRDMIKLHAQLFKKHGMTKIRNFDALNDVNNLIYSGQCILDAGLEHEIAITMMALPPGSRGAHDPKFYANVLRNILDAGIPFHSVCFKDASGTSTPSTVYKTIKVARKMLPAGTHIRFHTHETAGCSVICHKAALDAGADGIDLTMAPVSGGTSHADIVTMWHALKGTEYDLGINIDKILKAEMVFKECMKDYFFPPEAQKVEPLIPFSPMPGGALTANTQMMRDNNIMDKFTDIIAAMGEVVKKGGFGTSVTPVSQFYFQQAFNNVMFGNWKKIAEGYGKMILGYLGKTPVAPDPEIVEIASKQLGLYKTTESPLDIDERDPEKGVEASKKMLSENGLEITDENIFIAGTCKEKGIAFLKGEGKVMVRKKEKEPVESEIDAYTVNINNKKYSVTFDGDTAIVNGKKFNFSVKKGIEQSQHIPDTEKLDTADAVIIKAPIPGSVFNILVKVGDVISEGDVVMILESMKMETEIKSAIDGTISSIPVALGQKVDVGQDLIHIR